MDSFRNYNIQRMLQLIIILILLRTATCAIEYGYERNLAGQPVFNSYGRQSEQQNYDNLRSNLQTLFKERASDPIDNNESVENFNEFKNNVYKINNRHVDEALKEALVKIKEKLLKFYHDGLVSVEMPVAEDNSRHKRDVTNDTLTNVTSTEINVIGTVITTEKPETVTEKLEALRVKNVTVNNEVLLSANNDTETVFSGRRMMPMITFPPETQTSRVKDKLLSYLEDTFNEVEKKIKPLTNIKIALSNDDHYKIGYIIATIDTLEINLQKLRNDMNLHQHVWDDEKILNLFDRIKATNIVTTTLIETLLTYLPRN